jgi:hypothetical protein
LLRIVIEMETYQTKSPSGLQSLQVFFHISGNTYLFPGPTQYPLYRPLQLLLQVYSVKYSLWWIIVYFTI